MHSEAIAISVVISLLSVAAWFWRREAKQLESANKQLLEANESLYGEVQRLQHHVERLEQDFDSPPK